MTVSQSARRAGVSLVTLGVCLLGCLATGQAQVKFLEGEVDFAPPLADVNSPSHYMGVYLGAPLRHTLPSGSVAGASEALGDQHLFWSVGFGEEFVLASGQMEDSVEGSTRQARWALFLDGDAHMLLDFFAHSAAVMTTDFRLGGGLMGRGLPWLGEVAPLGRLSWRLKFFHESTHLGDEYLTNAIDSQSSGKPEYVDFRRVNVTMESVEGYLAWEDVLPWGQGRATWRAYGGYRFLLRGPWITYANILEAEIASPDRAHRHEAQLGLELRHRLQRGGGLPIALVGAGEAYLRRQYRYDPRVSREDLRQVSWRGLAGLEFGRPDKGVRFRVMADVYDGINPRGQFRDQTLRYGGLLTQLDY